MSTQIKAAENVADMLSLATADPLCVVCFFRLDSAWFGHSADRQCSSRNKARVAN